ncbi:hypothetical protein [Rhizobium sp. EC-SD404]|uniref:hypothetical protein n=1 Tax=Rhizobium sp. EC-SD404 TaxID=2038389 RepID=UPI00125357FD|nr:hypothetical protein [Rhizobium sp. EC-SD404]VVT32966.1 conserved hypothetical protein [Rhizobium sp. EC-SD404]
MMGPAIRIALRYGVGGMLGLAVGDALSRDPDVVNVATVAASVVGGYVIERVYVFAKKRGWAT